MNQKKAKAVRRFVREAGKDPKDARYLAPSVNGKAAHVEMLRPACGRALYLDSKRAAA